MKKLLTLSFLLTAFFGFSQPWNYVGSSTGINNASEVDIEVSGNGQLFMAYIDSDNTNKITVKKWINQSWQLVGTAGQGNANAFDLQLVMNGENPVVGAKYVSTGNEYLECYAFNGTVWNSLGVGTYFWTYHNREFAISCNTTGDVFATYYNREYQTFPEGLITVKLGTGTMIGGGLIDDHVNGFLQAVGSVSTTGNNVLVAFEEDMDMDYGIAFSSVTTSTHNTETYYYGTDATKLVFEKGLNSTRYSMMHLTGGATKYLYYQATNGTGTYGTQLTVASGATLPDFDFASQDANTFVYYRLGSTCYFKQITGDMTPSGTITTITSGTTLCPGSATSLAAETYYGVHVIAYIDGGKCYVKEYNTPADIDDWANVNVCEGGSWNNNGDYSIYMVDNNFSQANITLTCTSQNTSIIPQSALTVSTSGNVGYLSISSTNPVSANTTIDLKWDMFENGNLIETIYMPATVYNSPTIAFNFPSVQACENGAPISLLNKATPAGGTWSGTGVSGNMFNPGALNPSPSASTYLVYTKTSPMGCSATDSILFTVNETPNLVITSTNADCNDDNGSASVTISGGTPSYTSYWSNGSTFTSIANLEPGQYYFNTTDANGCIAVGVASVGSNGITLSETITDVTCNGSTTGAINLNVSGSNGPFTYAWSNGATTQDVNNLAAGSYEVVITDSEDCISMASYEVLQPAPITLQSSTTTQPSCGGSNGGIATVFTGGSQPFTYQWENAGGTNIGTNSASISSLAAGYYFVNVTDDEGCVHTETLLLSNPNGPVIVLDTVTPSDCSDNGTIEVIDVNGGSSFEWSTGATTQNLTNVGVGSYVLEATGGNGCNSYLTADVPEAQPEFTEICLVTVDTNTNTNLVVWEKPISSTIDHFNIYRETSQAGVYQLAGSVPYTDESLYTDLVASPSVRSWRYKITSVNGCGMESDMSDHHKTVHLTINQGLGGAYNLAWDSYEGFPYSEFIIWRHTDVNDWEVLATMPTNLFTYTDVPPTENGLEYLVEIEPSFTCTTTKMIQDFNTTRSNKDKVALEVASIKDKIDSQVSVYPVPSDGIVQVGNTGKKEISARLLDQTGRLIAVYIIKPGVTTIDGSTLANGVYTLELSENEALVNKRIVIQK